MSKKSPKLVQAERTIELMDEDRERATATYVRQIESIHQKDRIIEDIHDAEKRMKADLDKASGRIKELEMENTKIKLDEVMAGWALKANELQLQRALGWIDCSRDVHPGQTELIRGKDLFPKESPNED